MIEPWTFMIWTCHASLATKQKNQNNTHSLVWSLVNQTTVKLDLKPMINRTES